MGNRKHIQWNSSDDFFKQLDIYKDSILYGPTALFQHWVDHGGAREVEILRGILKDPRLERLHRSYLLASIAKLRSGLEVDLEFLRKEIGGTETPISHQSIAPHVISVFEEYAKQLRAGSKQAEMISTDSAKWSLADWRILNLLHDRYSKIDPSKCIIEKTPLFFAYEGVKLGKVFTLVGEKMEGGPAIVSPDWWRIGFLKIDSLVEAVNNALKMVLGKSHARCQIRWWIETHNEDMTWGKNPAEISSALSNTASAACLGMALLERKSAEELPLLDIGAGVTAVVDSTTAAAGTSLENLSLGKVEGFDDKFNAAVSTGKISTILAHQDSTEGCSSQNGVEIQPVKTLGEVYHALTDSMQDYRLAVAERWGRFLEELPGRYHNPNPSGKRFEVATGQEYIDASNKR